jgi:hypothetical protein
LKSSADFHNFGKAVTKFIDNGTAFYLKPRPVYWEWLFFGNETPLKELLNSPLQLDPGAKFEGAISIASSVLGLQVSNQRSIHSGFSREISRIDKFDLARSHEQIFKYGVLIFYCYVFGILDIHNENIIFSENRFQVIDAEIVLSKLLLPDETLLLPFKDISFEDSALCLVFKSLESLSPDDFFALVAGFASCAFEIDKETKNIDEILNDELSKNLEVPIRVIFRNTRKYYQHLRGEIALSLMPEEKIQMDRGDIPYFFKFINHSDLFWYTSPEGEFQTAQVPDEFLTAVNRVGICPSVLLDKKRIRKDLFAPGVLLLARKLLPLSWSGQKDFGFFSLEVTPTLIAVSSGWGKATSTRIRGMT